MPSRSYHPIRELVLARAREFYREPEAIFWVYVFPIILAVALGIAFRSKPGDAVRAVVEDVPPASISREILAPRELLELLSKDPRIQVELEGPEEAERALMRGRADILIRPGAVYTYRFDPSRTEGALARAIVHEVLQGRARPDPVPASVEPVTAPGSRYIDFLIPGLIGMNILGGGLWGVGFMIVDMRVRKLLKRFLATPLRKGDFLLSMVLARMLFLLTEIVLLVLVGTLGFGVPLRGSILALAAVVFVSALSFSGIGLLVASRAQKIETASGIMNVVMLPMWIFSGIFFSAERFPDYLQPFIQALPLTATNDALRAVMLEGQPLATQAGELLNLAIWGIASFALSLKWFRWS